METLVTVIMTVVVTLAVVHLVWKVVAQGETLYEYFQRIVRLVAYAAMAIVACLLAVLTFELILHAPVAWLQDNFGETTGHFYRQQLGERVSGCIFFFWIFAIVAFFAAAFGGMFEKDGALHLLVKRKSAAKVEDKEE